MKKYIIVIIAVFLVLALSACEPKAQYEIAMITDSGSIDDESFNQGTWEGIVEFAEMYDKTYKYYKASEGSTDAYVSAIDLAVDNGAKVIVTPGFLFEESVFIAQDKYPDVSFILIDGTPHNADYSEFLIGDRTLSILFKEEEAGFLAGYAAVAEGFTNFGFVGGMAVPSVVRFGIGYISGIYYGAQMLDKEISFTTEHYTYLGSFLPSDEFKNLALSWYVSGVDIIFSAAGGAGASIISAASESNAYVIGVDIDQSSQSDTIFTTAVKELGHVVFVALDDYYSGLFGGTVIRMGVYNDGIGLPYATSLFTEFTESDYNNLLNDIRLGNVIIPSSYQEFIDFAMLYEINIENAPVIE
ncbi:MAG: BMP family ABC transporter substrate-binding protein [Candidatus Izemoplasma sp.]